MTQNNQIYKCEVCGNMVEVVHSSGGTLVCCGKPMKLIEENTVDASKEKHVPKVSKIDGGVEIKVGEVEHPMQDNHYIEWVEVVTSNKVYRKYFKPQEKPEAMFKLNEEPLFARAYCSTHGLWKIEI